MKDHLVLIIEDDEDISFLLSHLLSAYNIPSLTAKTLSAAYHILEQSLPTHVFLDKILPDGNGLEFAGYLKDRYPDVGITLSTSYFEDIDESFLKDNTLTLLKKPFTREKVQCAIMSMAEAHI